MWSAIRVAATGAQAQERALDAAAHNLANVNTTGYKSRRPDLVEQAPGPSIFSLPTRAGDITMTTENVGQGVTVAAMVSDQSAGVIQFTGQPLDLAIVGEGFMQATLPDGRAAYFRGGALHTDGLGRLVTGGGALVDGVEVPPNVTELTIRADGIVFGTINGLEQPVGRLQLTRFANPDGLLSYGNNLFLATAASGVAEIGDPGTNGLGTLAPGQLEASNVDMGEEMSRIIQAQRAYQLNLRALRTMDEMLQEANNFRR
jgi:flagellar basal-body rod protein FlgG